MFWKKNSFTEVTFTNWRAATNEPNDFGSGEDCVYAYIKHSDASRIGLWNDIRCNSFDTEYVCEKEGEHALLGKQDYWWCKEWYKNLRMVQK